MKKSWSLSGGRSQTRKRRGAEDLPAIPQPACGLNPALTLRAVTLAIQSPWSSEAPRREEMKQGEKGRQSESQREEEGPRRAVGGSVQHR